MAVVVITGASSGIGEAAARLLAARGHQLVLAARRTDRLAALAAALAPAAVLTVPADVADPEALAAVARAAAERFGGIDVWINNAGMGEGPRWWEAEPEQIQRVIAVNLTAAILGARAALAFMLPQGRGQIINVASVAGRIGTSGVYSATKFGLAGHTEALRRELMPYGIRVSLLTPGFFRTEMTQDVPLRMPPASVAAAAIARLIDRPRRELVVPGWYRPLIWMNTLFPGLVDRLMVLVRRRARRYARSKPLNQVPWE